MERIRRALWIAVAVCAASMPALAQPSVTVSMSANPTNVRRNQALELQVRAQVSGGSLDDLKLPDLGDFEIIAQQVSTPIQFSFSTGSGAHVQSTKIYTFRLRPLRAGTIELSPAEARVDGKTYRSNAVTIVVSGDGATDPDPTPSTPTTRLDPYAFLQTVVEPVDPYVGQQVTVTVELYTRLQIGGRSVVPKKPATEGFWVHELPSPEFRPREVLVDGTTYRAYTLYKFAAFPQRAGKLEIGSPEVTFDTAGFGLFDPTERIERRGAATEVDVKPLPQPVPSGVVVGSFRMRASLDRTQVRTGDAVTLVATVVGSGNLQDVQLTLPRIEGVRTLDPRIEDHIEAPGGQLEGRRNYEWILVAERPGEYTIPALELTCFDPSTGQYTATRSEPVYFTAAGNPIAAPPDSPLIGPRRTAAPDVSFGPVRTRSSLDRGYEPIRTRAWFTSALLAPPLLFLCMILLTNLNRRLEKRKSKSMRNAVRDTLHRATKHAKQGEATAFYGEIAQTILDSLKLRLGEPVSGLTHQELRDLLGRRGAPEDLTHRIIDELESCDFARFSSAGTTSAEMEQCLGRTHALIERIDRLEQLEAST